MDWKTNTDNGQGVDTKQYAGMRELSSSLNENNITFNISGYSKGGGLAQEAGLVSSKSQVFVFNSAGLPDEALKRTANSSFDSLKSRTISFSSEGDFLTYMNETTIPEKQIANAQYLKDSLEGDSWLSPIKPIKIDYLNPEMKIKRDSLNFVEKLYGGVEKFLSDIFGQGDNDYEKERDKYLQGLDKMIESSKSKLNAGEPFRLFPPVRTGQQEIIPDSMTTVGKLLGATKDEANIGRLYQHKMENVLKPMEASAKSDRESLQSFLNECG